MTLWTPAGLTVHEVEYYHQRVRALMQQGLDQEQAEREAWYDYYAQHPEKFTHRITFHFAPVTRKDPEPPAQITLKEYKDSRI